jgi:acetoin utilization deacetylase AcuC-like enzyme
LCVQTPDVGYVHVFTYEKYERSNAMPSERVLLVDDALFDLHAASANHPERPARLDAARAGMRRSGVATEQLPPVDADRALLERVHSAAYLDKLIQLRGARGMLDPDTYISPHSVEAALRAAGGVSAIGTALGNRTANRAIALVRPPGHHALPNKAMGFCLINNVAVGAEAARLAGRKRVAIVDIDVHHGNGTQAIYWRDPNVLYVSTHQFPFYPGTGDLRERGEGEGLGSTVNVPLSEGADDVVYAEAMDEVVIPALKAFAPEVVLISAGFDAFVGDPLAAMAVTADGFAYMVSAIARAADDLSAPVGMVLEGGYDLAGLEACVDAAARALNGAPARDPRDHPMSGRHRVEIERASAALEEA